MPTHLDSQGVLVAIAGHPAAFPDLKADIATMVQKLLVKQVKKCKGVGMLRAVASAIGREATVHMADVLNDKEVAALVKALDKVRAPSIEPASLRAHLVKLASGEMEPETPAPKRAARKAPAKGLMEQTSAFAESHLPGTPPPAPAGGGRRAAGASPAEPKAAASSRGRRR
ncbi:hypothetical protein [Xanthobacter sp. KR7-225]|uniref:hypothetical protein n=1 Tax=Xanthobacter sp. KR7-225 TaxID=3156613 RepID=UPI0032B5DB35